MIRAAETIKVGESAGQAMTCPVCGHALTSFCPKCRGTKGGKVSSPKKTAAVRQNAAVRKPKAKPAEGD